MNKVIRDCLFISRHIRESFRTVLIVSQFITFSNNALPVQQFFDYVRVRYVIDNDVIGHPNNTSSLIQGRGFQKLWKDFSDRIA